MRRVFWAAFFFLLLTAFDSIPGDCAEDCPTPTPPTDTPEISQHNPTQGWYVTQGSSMGDPLSTFGRPPLDEPYYVPSGGRYQDPERSGPHYGMDFTNGTYWRDGIPQPVYAIGPGVVSAVHSCPSCWAEGDAPWGSVHIWEARYNFGFGGIVLIEHPFDERTSFYTLYAHLREIDVHVGQIVHPDIRLALLGGTGDAAAPHLHLELRYGSPGLFWGADFNNEALVERWLYLPSVSPNFLLQPEHHPAFVRMLEHWSETAPEVD